MSEATPRLWLRRLRKAALLLLVPFLALLIYISLPYPAESLSHGGPLVITDRYGTLLRSLPSEDGRPGRAAWVTLDQIPSIATLALLASEDANFYKHWGVDFSAIGRALWLNVREGHAAYGASTLTMQLVRMLESEGQPRSFSRKAYEALLALRLERSVSKQEILEQYLNRAYYGSGAYGIEAAAQTFFGKSAASLSVAEAVFLIVLPRAPSYYDPTKHKDHALARREKLFQLLVEKGLAQPDEVERARAQPLSISLQTQPDEAPHFVAFVKNQIPIDLYKKGGILKTTLDLRLQKELQYRLREEIAARASSNLTQGGAVILDTQRGEILAMVGSADFEDTEGELNITTWRRNPGSALKPFLYALALSAGDTPASIAEDIVKPNSGYKTLPFSQKEHGPVRYREALAGSYNLAAVHLLEKIGVDKLRTTLQEAGIQGLSPSFMTYGLRLALGSARVRLLDLASAYGFLVRDGTVRTPSGIRSLTLADGTTWKPPKRQDKQLFSPEVSWQIMDILADTQARHGAFGQETPLDFPFPVACKTGTARGFADTWAVCVTQEYTVAVWAGNFNGTANYGLPAMRAAAPIANVALQLAARSKRLTLPAKPPTLQTAEVCPLSGLKPGPACPQRKREYFTAATLPRETCHWHQQESSTWRVVFPPLFAAWGKRNWSAGGANFDGVIQLSP